MTLAVRKIRLRGGKWATTLSPEQHEAVEAAVGRQARLASAGSLIEVAPPPYIGEENHPAFAVVSVNGCIAEVLR